MNKITSENLPLYIANGENETIEFKRFPERRSILRLISAFANTKGGSIIFGYDEREKNIVGITDDHLKILNHICQEKEFYNICSFYTFQYDKKIVAVLEVQKSRKDIYVNNNSYTRVDSQVLYKSGITRSSLLKQFISEIQYKNRNPQDVRILESLSDLTTNPERKIIKGTRLYRCRIINNIDSIGKEEGFYGFGKKDSFVPPPDKTRDMRANYRYIPYLYCANHPYTALVEVRPRLGADVSVATITVNEDLTILDFTLKNKPKKIKQAKENLFSDLSMIYSKPVVSDDDVLDYIPTQFIAEYAKNLGYDGIAFRSSLTPELDDSENKEYDIYNIVVFNYEKCEATSSSVVKVTRNYLEFKQTDKNTEHTLPLNLKSE